MSVSSHPFLSHMLYITSSNLPHSSAKIAGSTGFPQRPQLCTGSHLSFAGPYLEKTLNSNLKFTLGCLFLLQAWFLGRFFFFFLAYGNVLTLIWSFFLSHFLTKVLKKGIHRKSWSAISDIFTSVKKMNMVMDFRHSSSTYLIHLALQTISQNPSVYVE